MAGDGVTGDGVTGPALPVAPGLCGDCRYAARNTTRRGPTYLRCTRATWDDRLVRYPRLSVTACVGFETPPPPAVRVT